MSSASSPTKRLRARYPAPSNQSESGRASPAGPGSSKDSVAPNPAAPRNASALNSVSYARESYKATEDTYRAAQAPSVYANTQPQRAQTVMNPASSYVTHASRTNYGPQHQQYPVFLSLAQTLLFQTSWAATGLKDAFRWDLVAKLVMSDAEIRAHMIKSFALNSLGLISVYAFDLILMPLLHRSASASSIASTSGIYHIFWLLPVVGGSLYMNGIWCSTIAEKVYTMQHGRQHAATTMTYSSIINTIASSAYRIILIVTSVSVSFALSYIPLVGSSLSFLFVCWVDSYYCFEFAWQAQGLSLAARVKYLEERWAYFLGFGLPTTALCYMGSSLANAALFALIFPSYIILAMYADPQPKEPNYPAQPIRNAMTGEETYPLPSPLIPVRLPIFKLVIWINTWVIRGIDLITGGGRRSSARTSGAARDGKRWEGEEDFVESGIPLKSPFLSGNQPPSSAGLKSRMRME